MLDKVAQVSQIVIALGAIVSSWFALKALQKSDWRASMSTAPSIVIRPNSFMAWRVRNGGRSDLPKEGFLFQEDFINDRIEFEIEFSCQNLGRGIAFNIERPKIIGLVNYHADNHIPLYLSPVVIAAEEFTFSIRVSKTFDEWLKAAEELIPVEVKILCCNDQNTISCFSWWSANLQPFKKIRDDMLAEREFRVLNRKGGVKYSPVKKQAAI